MKTQQDIEKEIIQEFISNNDDVTYLGVGGVMRGFITAVSMKIRELWYDLTQTKRKLFLNTSQGTDLDSYAADRNITRNSGRKAGTMIVFSGSTGTIIPAGTVVSNPVTNIGYTTLEDVTIGTKNPQLEIDGKINLNTIIVGDACWAECNISGTAGNSSPNTITKCNVTGITSATNPMPAQGGTDTETDDELRYRIKNYVKLLNQDTISYYETLTFNTDNRILRVLPYKDYSKPDAIKLVLVAKNGSLFKVQTLAAIASNIMAAQKSFSLLECVNIEYTPINIDMRVRLNTGYDFQTFFNTAVEAFSTYFDWSKWDWGSPISADIVYTQVRNLIEIKDIELTSFKINNSLASKILLNSNISLPYFSGLKITNIDNPTESKTTSTLIQSYQNIENINQLNS